MSPQHAHHTRLPDWTLDEVDPNKMKVLALLLADPNPLHFDPAAAPALGIAPQPVNQGPSNMAMLVNVVQQAYPQGKLRRLAVRLSGSVMAGQSVRATGQVVATSTDENCERIRCDVALRTGEGSTVLSGEAVVEIPLGSE